MGARLSAKGLDALHEVASRHVGDGAIPGLVALVAHGDEVHVETLGVATIGGREMTRDTLFRIASTTKPLTATAALALVSEGLLDLDEPVARLLPELATTRVLRRMDGPLSETVPAARPITVRDLMTFTFGFGFVAEMFMTPEKWPIVAATEKLSLSTLGPPNPESPPDPDTWMARFASLPLLSQPGYRWMYNTGASVLGVLVSRAAGTSLGEAMRTRLFEPLGMSDTAFVADPDRLGTEYRSGEDGLAVVDPPDGQWSKEPAFCDGAAGLVSSADDLLAVARMLMRGGSPVLPAELVEEMTRDQLTESQRRGAEPFLQERSWGLCQAVSVSGPWAGSYGWDGGLGTSWLVDPVREMVVIVLTQRMWDTAELPPVHSEIQDAAYAALAPAG